MSRKSRLLPAFTAHTGLIQTRACRENWPQNMEKIDLKIGVESNPHPESWHSSVGTVCGELMLKF
jgi:hypothetical protein